MARIIHEVQPRYAFVENSPMLTARGLGRVLGDLAAMGFDARWGVLGAADIGAKHQRDRIWIVGKATDSTSLRPHNEKNQRVLESQRGSEFYSEQPRHSSKVAYSQQQGLERQPNSGEQEVARLRGCGALADTKDKGDVWRDWELGFAQQKHDSGRGSTYGSRKWWSVEPAVGRVVNGVAARVDRLKAIGNGQVPQCAATAWRILSEQ
jgi:DNA (cytosine-5)-methyltransferase 1